MSASDEQRDYNAMKISELKKLLASRGQSTAGLLEKSEYVALAKQTESTSSSSSSNSLKLKKIGNATNPSAIVIILHGYGANNGDFEPAALEIRKRFPRALCVLPNAPISLGGQSVAWWPLDLQAMMMKMFTVGASRLFDGPPPAGLDEARRCVLELVARLLGEYADVTCSDIVLAGFSQGAMLAVDVALHMSERPGALVVWSGAFVAPTVWSALADRLAGVPIRQTHGSQDPILPYQCGADLNRFLATCSDDIKFAKFNGQHSLGPKGLQLLLSVIPKYKE
jgi:phospholipase/carboxylesterase